MPFSNPIKRDIPLDTLKIKEGKSNKKPKVCIILGIIKVY